MDIEELKNQKQELNKPDKFYFKGQPEFSPSLVGMPSFVHYSCYVDLKQVLTNAINFAESLQSELTKVKEERDSLKADRNKVKVELFNVMRILSDENKTEMEISMLEDMANKFMDDWIKS